MNNLFEAGLEIQEYIESKNWLFCFIGGMAVLRWGEPRMTQDVDVCLLSGFGNEEKFIQNILATFETRIKDAFAFAITNRVLLLYASNGIGIDLTLSGIPFEERMIERGSPFYFTPNYSLITCSAEDLVVLPCPADVCGYLDEFPSQRLLAAGKPSQHDLGLHARRHVAELEDRCETVQEAGVLGAVGARTADFCR